MVFLEKDFFEQFYLHLKASSTQSATEDSDILSRPSFELSIHPINVLDFYSFDRTTSALIIAISTVIVMIFVYIIFSKLYLKKIINNHKKTKNAED